MDIQLSFKIQNLITAIVITTNNCTWLKRS